MPPISTRSEISAKIRKGTSSASSYEDLARLKKVKPVQPVHKNIEQKTQACYKLTMSKGFKRGSK